MRDMLLVAVGGAIGSLGRYGISVWTKNRYGDAFPWGTLIVNVTGSLLLGVVLGLSMSSAISKPAKIALGAGFMGAFTTFSTFSADTVLLVQNGKLGSAALNVAANVVVGLLAAVVGFWVAKTLSP